MTLCRFALVCAVFSVGVALATPVLAQGKKKPASYPGAAGFRCDPAVSGQCPVPAAPDDGIVAVVTAQNPSGTYPGSGTPEGGRGAHLRIEGTTANHEMWIGLRDGFEVLLKFGAPDPNAPCRSNGNNYCQYPGAFGPGADSIVIGRLSYAELQTDVVDALGSGPTLMTLAQDPLRQNDPAPVRLLIGFNDVSGRLWNFNFSDARNSGAENASVWRTGPCTWVITDGASQAELSTLIRLSGKQFRSFEGLYAAPFELTFTAPTCPAQ